MKYFLVLFTLIAFSCSLALAADTGISSNPSQDKDMAYQQRLDNAVLSAEEPDDYVSDIQQYCTSTYTNTTDDWISNVTFNTINNNSGQDGAQSYGDYTAISTDVEPGQTYTLTVTVYSEGLWTEHVRAWIDWNNDEVFTGDESYYLGSGVDPTLSVDVTVPMDAVEAATRLRVIEQYSTDPGEDGACDGQGNHSTIYGETEDYTVNVGEPGPCDVVCPPGGMDEGEPDCGPEYADDYNGGCNSSPEVFSAIAIGDTICGTSGTYLVGGVNTRDTDWFEYVPGEDMTVNFTVNAEFNLQIGIIDGTAGCDSMDVVVLETSTPCVPLMISYDLIGGNTYWFWVGPSEFTGWDCPLDYVAILEMGQSDAGDNCDHPYIIDAFPFTDAGYSCDYSNECDITGSDNSDIIYEMEIAEEITLVASLVGSDYDTKIAVFMDGCCTGEGTEFLYNDDYDGLQSQVEGTFMPGTYYVVVDGYGTACGNYSLNIYETEPPPPPPCEQDIIPPDGNWNFLTSDVELGPYVVYDNFSCPQYNAINSIQYWGLDLHYAAGWSECTEDPTEMNIGFYNDVGGQPDRSNPVCMYTVQPQITYTGTYYGSIYELVEYTAEFDSCGMNEGWVSIQGALNDGAVCVFMWGCSEGGDLYSFQEQSGNLVQQDLDLAKYMLWPTDIDESGLLPTQYDKLANYPNPFNAQTTIAFSLKNSGNVAIDIYDVLGRRVDELQLGYLDNTQIYTVKYDASDLATGVYFYSLMVDGEKKVTDRFSLLK